MANDGTSFAAPSMPSDAEAGKRAYRRLPRAYSVDVAKLAFPMPEEGMLTACCDISPGGLCVEAPAGGFAPGETCRLKVLIPLLNKFSPGFFKVYENDAEQYFTALATVAWVKPLSGRLLVGFKFVNVHDDQMRSLEKLIERAFAK